MKETIDRSALEKIRLASRKEDIAQRMIQLYLKGAPGLLQTLQEAADNTDLGCMKAAAHALSKISENVGARRLATLASRVERRAALRPRSYRVGLSQQLNLLRAEHERVQEALAQLLQAKAA